MRSVAALCLRVGKHLLITLLILLCSLWLAMAVWIQQPLPLALTISVMVVWLTLSALTLGSGLNKLKPYRPRLWLSYSVLFGLGLLWYFNIPAKQDRQWAPEVAQQLSYERDGNTITLHNVRNFNWHSESHYDERWETRRYDLSQITGVNVMTSYWMGPQIAHTLVSFDFKNQAPLVFSIEIRKEQNEQFSAIGGFFRQFELSLIAADEHDIVYTRSNVRGEQVYFFPINHLSQQEMQALFLAYLQQADALRAQPSWYNSLSSNCTTLVYDMAKSVSRAKLPLDYRLIASGYLPNYLYDLKALSPQWDMQTWYRHAHVNPRVNSYPSLSSAEYSRLIRQGLPTALAAKP
ncbi:DUF4105 domain-containing protein [Vitreoscilla massiliensis]|uniref:DUF4105 domain-containing protein n=1 Tax=Vitreoscilla massiliensis TaxID=1689272 RepID=A0ABY4E6G3_9NEIS|nr:DUF4105 domain-containing protein [Vitreoscilla massiliensis]UOO90898.1 DUF4105 domain-containing protein [Vitreoscilla massiliensis]